eukprot:scaffold872_cov119-Skeletonema_dohrnii-CCMP3373.AAC.13
MPSTSLQPSGSSQPSLEFCAPKSPTEFAACNDTTTGDISAGSCLGEQACRFTTGDISAGSCIGGEACLNATGDISAGSCIGNDACRFTTGDISAGSCYTDQACLNTKSNVGVNSCTTVYASRGGEAVCQSSTGSSIGNNSLLFIFTLLTKLSRWRPICRSNKGNIGDQSCHDSYACYENEADIGNGSCKGEEACYLHGVDPIGSGSCNGFNACDRTTGKIGKNSCNGVSACCGVTGDIDPNTCNGDSACCNAAISTQSPSPKPKSVESQRKEKEKVLGNERAGVLAIVLLGVLGNCYAVFVLYEINVLRANRMYYGAQTENLKVECECESDVDY